MPVNGPFVAPPTPMQHAVYQLTDTKVHAEPTPKDYEPPDPVEPQPVQWAGPRARASASATIHPTTAATRTRTRAMATRTRYRTEKSVTRELWPLEPPSYVPPTPPV